MTTFDAGTLTHGMLVRLLAEYKIAAQDATERQIAFAGAQLAQLLDQGLR